QEHEQGKRRDRVQESGERQHEALGQREPVSEPAERDRDHKPENDRSDAEPNVFDREFPDQVEVVQHPVHSVAASTRTPAGRPSLSISRSLPPDLRMLRARLPRSAPMKVATKSL